MSALHFVLEKASKVMPATPGNIFESYTTAATARYHELVQKELTEHGLETIAKNFGSAFGENWLAQIAHLLVKVGAFTSDQVNDLLKLNGEEFLIAVHFHLLVYADELLEEYNKLQR